MCIQSVDLYARRNVQMGRRMSNVGIIGAGSWGCALAKLLHNNGNQVTVWSIMDDEISMLKKNHEHKDKLPGVILPDDMNFTTDIEQAAADKDVLVLAVPSPFTRSPAAKLAPYIKYGQKIVNVAKGIEETTLMTLSEVVEQEIPNAAEIARLGISMGGRIETFYGLTGIGDLIVTCASMHSRNRRAGILIGKGASMDEAMKEVKMVVEGVYSAKAGYALAQKYGVNVPIIEQVNKILFERKPASEAVSELMLRDKKVENIDLRTLYQNSVEIPW